MILLLSGASHSGKTLLAQKLMQQYGISHISIDHIKMGLIRSGQTQLTPMDDDKLTDYLWPILREMVKTAVENRQSFILEGCYIPFGWQADFAPQYLEHIRYCCLILSKNYIEQHSDAIRAYACAAEQRLDDSGLDLQQLIAENEQNLAACKAHGLPYILIEDEYNPQLPFALQ